MQKPNIKTSKKVVPMIYAYTTPGVTYHDGYIKIGYTEQDVDKRIYDQTHTAGIRAQKEWQGTAIYDDGTGKTFLDHDFHRYLRKKGFKQPQDLGNEYFDENDKNEWFNIEPQKSEDEFHKFKKHDVLENELENAIPYKLREEQNLAVEMTRKYRESHENGEFLWNAKPRFGKTLSVYDFCKRINAISVLIVTNRPAIANSWYSDYMKFLGKEAGYLFVSEVDSLKDKLGVMSRQEYIDYVSHASSAEDIRFIEFVSLQDLKGSIYFGGEFDKLKEVQDMKWDLLVVDEAHEGVDTYKTDVAFDRIDRKFTLHLSGTPFKALANNKFSDDAIFNWTYADEQAKKINWDDSQSEENPYEIMPKLNLYTYQMSEIIREELSQGIEINGETEEYAFDLNEFFRTNERNQFVYEKSVDRFLDALTLGEKFPFSTEELRKELKHTFWLLDRVDSAKALARKLKTHPIFSEYEVVIAAGDGRLDEEEALKDSYNKVIEAINNNEKTITLSVGQLTTGVTIPEWTGVLILSNIQSPSLYMQAAFRAQNPCLQMENGELKRKENAYVFDFDPARTLTIYERFANDLAPHTANINDNLTERKNNIRTLLNFFPVIGEDENGELVELDAEKVLTIPRKIRSVEVVKRGFMSNFLFKNISQVFGGVPKEVMDIINTFEAIEEPTGKVNFSEEVKDDLQLDEDGNVSLSEEYVVGKETEIFGDKIYDITSDISQTVDRMIENSDEEEAINELKNIIKNKVTQNIIKIASEKYGDDLKPAEQKRIENMLNVETERVINKEIKSHKIDNTIIEQEKAKALQNRFESGKTIDEINEEFIKKQEEANTKFQEDIIKAVQNITENSKKETVKKIETKIKEKEKSEIENGIRDHLRGFSRTIPSFLMAYGDDTVTLATFDETVPENVFKEVTSITLDQFRFLRDGGIYTDETTGEEKEFKGNLFDEVVFDDSVKEFLALKKKLADYFDEKSIEDIFDYIPPQKTNQIYTPKKVVKNMVDMLEKENPGCFDNPDKTFIDLYMKSGLYIAEIVKRLYQSPKMKELFPNKEDRLKHIFERQVYGLAPTEIIYKIATSFILGFDEEVRIKNHNFRQVDSLPYAKDGKLDELVDMLYGDSIS
ncbi:MAG: DEAD/DEAH box helicase family protein [Clostridia bacterium]|nr:DEAD/DEAH box helicase family protein [Clostridia bacterium]